MGGIAGRLIGKRGVIAPGLMILLMAVLAGGCPQPKSAELVVVMGSGGGVAGEDKNGAVRLDEISSLFVTINKITVDYVGLVNLPEGDMASAEGASEEGIQTSEDDDASSEEGGPDLGSLGQIVIFEGDRRMDIRDLTDVAQILSTVDVDPGYYTKIRLYVSDPELRLTGDPETPLTNIHLTANARLFISKTFLFPEGRTSILRIDFESLHLVENDKDSYVWTPQIRAEVEVEDIEGN